MTIKRFALAAAIGTTLLAAACATMSTGSYVQQGVDFSRYRTWAWSPADALPIGDPRLENNAILRDYIQGAVERTLSQRRLLLVPQSANPDLLVHFHGSVRQRLDVSVLDANRGYRLGPDQTVVDYDEGTLVLDIVDARSDRLVWRGWAVDTLNGLIESQRRMKKKIEEAVPKMLAGSDAWFSMRD
jgi:hypothetical protein